LIDWLSAAEPDLEGDEGARPADQQAQVRHQSQGKQKIVK
jgi:hypothetical protein